MAKIHQRGFRLIIIPDDGAESRTYSLNGIHLALLGGAALVSLVTVIAAIVFWGTLATAKVKNSLLKNELTRVSEVATRNTQIEQNMAEIDQYIRYIREIMSLKGDELPATLEDFLANDQLRKSYEKQAGEVNFSTIPAILPVDGYLTRGYSVKESHLANDYAAPMGTIVTATANGSVIEKYFDNEQGNVVVIDHENGFKTKYAHCKDIVVSLGAKVKRGETIATVGNSGRATSGPHLHYEIIRYEKSVDPQLYIVKGL